MTRGVRTPRVVIPNATQEVADLGQVVGGMMEEDPAFTGVDGVAAEAQAIWETLIAEANACEAALNSAVEKENEARAFRATAAIKRDATLDELRNARDLILAVNPTDPMQISNYGFVAYASSANTGGSNDDGTTEDPPADDGSGDDGVTFEPT